MLKHGGFTLVELMITVAILAILAMVAVPNFGPFVQDGRMDTLQDRLASAMSLARSEAIRQGVEVRVCARTAPVVDDEGNSSEVEAMDEYSCGADWANGWAVAIEGGKVFQVYEPPASAIEITGGETVAFQSTGLIGGGDIICFVIGDNDDDTETRYVQVSPFGRVRSWDGGNGCDE